jgi:hypothetical protein
VREGVRQTSTDNRVKRWVYQCVGCGSRLDPLDNRKGWKQMREGKETGRDRAFSEEESMRGCGDIVVHVHDKIDGIGIDVQHATSGDRLRKH